MYSALMAAWALLLGMALIMLGNGLQGTLLGLRATLEGFPTAVTGFVMTGYFIGFLLGSTIAPKIVERVGHIRVFAALASLASASALVHALFIDPWTWGAMRIVTGFSYAGLYVVAESWLNDRATNETRGQILSIYMVVSFGGMTAGQFLLNLADPGGVGLFVLISVLVSLALVPISLTAASAPTFDELSPVGLRQLYSVSPLGVVGGLGTGLANGTIFGMGAVYGTVAGMTNAEISLFMGLILLGGMLLQWPVGRISDMLDRRMVILGVTVLAMLAALVAGTMPGLPVWMLLVVAFLFGGMSLPMYSLCAAHLNDYLDPKQMVAASSGFVLVSGLGAILGPTSASVAMHLAGAKGFFLWLALINCCMGLFALWRMTRRAAMPLEDQGPFVSMPPRGSPVAVTLNPETPEDAADWEEIPPDFDPMEQETEADPSE
jgi:MFS family permease